MADSGRGAVAPIGQGKALKPLAAGRACGSIPLFSRNSSRKTGSHFSWNCSIACRHEQLPSPPLRHRRPSPHRPEPDPARRHPHARFHARGHRRHSLGHAAAKCARNGPGHPAGGNAQIPTGRRDGRAGAIARDAMRARRRAGVPDGRIPAPISRILVNLSRSKLRICQAQFRV